jgi:uncharacterized protein (DUF362 family)
MEVTMTTLDRRTFLGSAAAVGAALTAGHTLAAVDPPDVVDVRGTDAGAMVRAALAGLGGLGTLVKKGSSVVIKGNFSFANPPEWGTGTHPEVLGALARAALEAGAREVLVVDYTLDKVERCLDRCGITAMMATVPGAMLRTLGAEDDFQEVKVPGGVALKSVDLAKVVRAADVFINAPVAKHHGSATVSLGLKNHMGVIRDRRSFHGADLHQCIADLGRVVRPHLTVIDATRALVSNGPRGPGDVVKPGRILAGRNVVSVDALGVGVARFGGRDLKPADVPHIHLAAQAGLGTADTSKLRVKMLTA